MTNNTAYHLPVMLKECLDGLAIRPDGIYVDVTFGGGGHSRAIFEQLSENGLLIAFDQDPDAAKNAWTAPNFRFIPSNFEYLKNHLAFLQHHGKPVLGNVDGILADLGVSSHQFDEGSRGFSIRGEAALDMRMNQQGDLDAFKVVNTYEEQQLTKLFRLYGEVDRPHKLAARILRERSAIPIRTTQDLMDVLAPFAPKFKEHKFFAQVFQAIRIEVNRELDVLQAFLEQSTTALRPGGRLVVMSYHSLEDRLVKNFLKKGNTEGRVEKDFYGNLLKDFNEVNRKPILAQENEVEQNTRARSAKLRIAEKR